MAARSPAHETCARIRIGLPRDRHAPAAQWTLLPREVSRQDYLMDWGFPTHWGFRTTWHSLRGLLCEFRESFGQPGAAHFQLLQIRVGGQQSPHNGFRVARADLQP